MNDGGVLRGDFLFPKVAIMAQLAVVFVFVRLVLHADFVEQIAQQLNGFNFCAV